MNGECNRFEPSNDVRQMDEVIFTISNFLLLYHRPAHHGGAATRRKGVCNRSGIRYAIDGMKGSPLKAPPIAMSTDSPFFLTVEIYPLTLQKFVAPSLLLNVPEIFC